MNKKRRKAISVVSQKLSNIRDELGTIQDEETFARENIPENLQGSNAYESSEETSDYIENAINNIEAAIDGLNSIQ